VRPQLRAPGWGGGAGRTQVARIAQIALAFLLTGPRTLAGFADNAGALEIDLLPGGRSWLGLETDDAVILSHKDCRT
jgi:hypothetical protein